MKIRLHFMWTNWSWKGQNMAPWSMDPHFGLGPWTNYMDLVHGPHVGCPSCFQKRQKRTIYFILNMYFIAVERAILPWMCKIIEIVSILENENCFWQLNFLSTWNTSKYILWHTMDQGLRSGSEITELKNANGYVTALRHRTWAQARAHLKWLWNSRTSKFILTQRTI